MGNKYTRAWRRARPIFQTSALAAVAASQQLFAQGGTIDTTAFTTLGQALLLLFQLIAVLGIAGGLIFSVFKFIGRDWTSAVGGVLTVIAGGVVIGYARTWATALTGVAL